MRNTTVAYFKVPVRHMPAEIHKCFFPMARQPLMGNSRLIVEASQSHSDTPHSAGLLCTSDQPVAQTST
jgi:hypothetical protein